METHGWEEPGRHRGCGTSLRGKEQPFLARTPPATAFPAFLLHWDRSKPLLNEWDLSPSLKAKDHVIPGCPRGAEGISSGAWMENRRSWFLALSSGY